MQPTSMLSMLSRSPSSIAVANHAVGGHEGGARGGMKLLLLLLTLPEVTHWNDMQDIHPRDGLYTPPRAGGNCTPLTRNAVD